MKKKFSSFTIIVLFILLILCGIPLVHYLNIELNPNATSSTLSVNFSWYGAEPRVVEQEATSKLEAMFARVQGVKDINSTSGNGYGSIVVTLDKNVNAGAIRFEISTLIRQAWPGLPKEVGYPQLVVNRPNQENERPLLSYTLNAPARANMVQAYATDYIRPLLANISGIYKVEIYGAMPYEWQIGYNPAQLAAIGITPAAVEQAVRQFTTKENLGTARVSVSVNPKMQKVGEELPVVLSQTNRDTILHERDFLNIPIARVGNRQVVLGDVATIKHSEAEPQNYYRINGLNTITILVYAAAGENNLALGAKVKEAMGHITKTLPKEFKLLLGDDSTEYIVKELHTIAWRTGATLFILMLFIFMVTRRWRHALLILITLAGNLSIAVIFYYLFKVEIHLYALAGITVSLGLMTDNIIIMSDHLRNRGNRKAWLAILAGTLATISSLVVIFFLDEHIKANLVDFALVIIINQSVSLLTALFVIPALMDKMKLIKNEKLKIKNAEGTIKILVSSNSQGLKFFIITSLLIKKYFHPFISSLLIFHSFIINSSRTHRNFKILAFYQMIYLLLHRWRSVVIVIFVLGFGLPVYMLPNKWEGEHWYNKVYNATIGNEWYIENIKPTADKILGGTLRLFTEKVFEGSYFGNSQETSLFITASLPHGTTLDQANTVVASMEGYLKQFREIRLFQANVSARQSSIQVYFTETARKGGFPYQLKGEVISKAIEIGGADWGVFGFGDGFSNSVQENAGSYAIRLMGYNYDELSKHANSLSKSLMANPRIKEVFTVAERSWYKPDNTEFVAEVDKELATANNVTVASIFASLQQNSLSQGNFASVAANGGMEGVKLISSVASETDVWQLLRMPLGNDTARYKFNTFSAIKKELTTPQICKENQQYRLYLQFDYIGSDKFARKYIDKTITEYKPQLPMGYSVKSNENDYYFWGQQDKKQYWLLGLIIVMIFFICAILFESLLQPFAVILTIPVGYIGIFLTFYLFDLNFDQGGFAALVMLSGISVNAAIYILNDYNNLLREHAGRNVPNIKLYFKAFNYKITPILLTIVSTVLGFVPFLIGEKQPFWFALASGTIGGLLFSLVGIVVYLPMFLRIRR